MTKAKLIIVEGADCTGKSTLAREICRKINAVYVHAGYFGDTPERHGKYLMDLLKSARINLQNGQSVVLDRHWVSEVCYAPVLRGVTDLSYITPSILECQTLKANYVLCFSSQAAKKQINHDSAHHYTASQYDDIYAKYITQASVLNSKLYFLEENGQDMAEFIQNRIL